MAGGDLLARRRIVHVFDAVLAQHKTPVGLRLFGEVRDDRLKHARGLIELASAQKPAGSGKQGQLSFVICARHGLLRAAVCTLTDAGSFDDFQIPAAHFAFDDRHGLFSPRG